MSEKPPYRDQQVLSLDELLCDRRTFCRTLAAGAAGLALVGLSGCGQPDRSGWFYTEGTDGGSPDDLARGIGAPEDMARGGNTGPVDMARGSHPPPDFSMPSNANACPSGSVTDTRKSASSFASDTATFISAAASFVCRDSKGLYCLSNYCTHQGCAIQLVSGPSFYCGCHGSQFSFSGSVTNGPARSPLYHYGLCLTGSNTVGIVRSTVSASTRYNF